MITSSYDFEPNYGRKEGIYMPTQESQEYFAKKARQRREWGWAALGCILAGLIILAYALVIPVSDAISEQFQSSLRVMPHDMLCVDKAGTLIPRGNEHLVQWKECRTVSPAN